MTAMTLKQISTIHVGNPFARAAAALIHAQSHAEQLQRLDRLSNDLLHDIGLASDVRSREVPRPMIWA